MQKKLWSTLVIVACVAGCSKNADAPVHADAKNTAAAYESALDAAREAQAKAGQSENQWTGAQNLMASAAQLAAEGKFQEAAEQLAGARQQYELAIAQAEREARDWQDRVVR